MDGWDGRMDGWMDGWMDERTDGQTHGRMDGWIDGSLVLLHPFKQHFSYMKGYLQQNPVYN